jgi:DNA-binding NtrC family response regulator
MESAYWAGNVRELKHAIERAVVVNVGGPINPADLGIISNTVQEAEPSAELLPFRDERERFERAYFTKLLQITGGNISDLHQATWHCHGFVTVSWNFHNTFSVNRFP